MIRKRAELHVNPSSIFDYYLRNNLQFDKNHSQLQYHVLQRQVSELKTKIIDAYEKEHGLRPTCWLRYIDEIFFVWVHGEKN